MIKLENTEVLGWEAAIRGMRNPMNSWEKSDSLFLGGYNCETGDADANDISDHIILFDMLDSAYEELMRQDYQIGPNDQKLMMNLAKAGSVDAKYRRMIVVTVDITAPLYWWKEFDTYKVGTVANSCSTMHKIQAKEFTMEDFSCEHLLLVTDVSSHDIDVPFIPVDQAETVRTSPNGLMYITISMLNKCRSLYLETKDKRYWWQMIQLLPSSYNQRRTVMLNYEVLAGIYPKRKDHKLDEWHTFCDWIKSLPYSEIITLEEMRKEK